MTRYQAESHRAAGAASTSPTRPKPRVTPGGLKAPRTGPKPNASTVPAPATQTSRREHHKARQLSLTAAIRSGSERSRARTRVDGVGIGPGAGRTPARGVSAVSGVISWWSSLEIGGGKAAGEHVPAR